MGAVGSMALYGAPVWTGDLMAPSQRLLMGLQRKLAIRIVRGYRTVPLEAALVVSGSIPWDLLAEAYQEMYDQKSDLRRWGLVMTPKATEAARQRTKQRAVAKWSEDLLRPRAGVRTVQAIQPIFPEWLSRKPGLSYRVVQVMGASVSICTTKQGGSRQQNVTTATRSGTRRNIQLNSAQPGQNSAVP
ncbi:uncharacterized protein LOC114941056 [Nylanderia fulva]|uniref:uncharacterized protein LOC114931194 n=1 Tax=Nylanderia fulva TaxID=613905 RepID=UPI0010FBAB8B|nr:uncharacterized protein LOC114931194 [Nylanderia fulva]XP_029171731.1 uncharacterized protein LOC114941056 [Nylanderia fulva]